MSTAKSMPPAPDAWNFLYGSPPEEFVFTEDDTGFQFSADDSGLSPDEERLLSIAQDPVKWAEMFLRNPDHPDQPLSFANRPYQRNILRDMHRKIVMRCGRRIGKTVVLAVIALWHAMTKPDTKILIVTPYESQVKLIFDEKIKPMIELSPEIQSSIVKVRNQPFEIIFSNRSKIFGMTAGSKSGQHGSSIRGQDASVIIIDEGDLLSQQSVTAVEAIMTTHADVRMIVSSTPTGKREWFYKICTDPRLGYHEYHYRSSDGPEWTPEVEQYFRLTHPIEDYEHEFDAEFGAEANGVFNPDYIDTSLVLYRYSDINPVKPQGNVRVIGVDWNAAKNGVQIVVLEWMRKATAFPHRTIENDGQETLEYRDVIDKLAIVQHVEIHAREMTQKKAIEAVFRLTAEYNVDHVYVDEGYGHTNVEDLITEGRERYPNLQITTKLKSFNMSSVIEIEEPIDHTLVNKPIKPYMVGQAQLRLEQDMCILPQIEDFQTGIVGQMRSYMVLNINDKGVPRFSVTNDHALDAWMIAILGLTEEYSTLKQLHAENRMIYMAPHNMLSHLFLPKRDWAGKSAFEDTPPDHTYAHKKIVASVQKAGLHDKYVFGGDAGLGSGGPRLSDDSDEAYAYRQRVHDNQFSAKPGLLNGQQVTPGGQDFRLPWMSRRERSGRGPTRTNITVGGFRTPWGGRRTG